MKTKVYSLLILFSGFASANIFGQIPNNGFENWTPKGIHEIPAGWYPQDKSSDSLAFYPITKSTDHYPASVGTYSVRLETSTSLQDMGGMLATVPLISGHPLTTSFPLTGHHTSFCGYYKWFPQNNDTMTIILILFKNGQRVAQAILNKTDTLSNWTSFNILISGYATADSATIGLFCFYADTISASSGAHYGESVLFVDNLSFDNLISGISEVNEINRISVYPNPLTSATTLQTDKIFKDAMLTVYNSFGQQVQQMKNIFGQTIILHRDNLPGGLYFIRLTQDNKIISADKLVITD